MGTSVTATWQEAPIGKWIKRMSWENRRERWDCPQASVVATVCVLEVVRAEKVTTEKRTHL